MRKRERQRKKISVNFGVTFLKVLLFLSSMPTFFPWWIVGLFSSIVLPECMQSLTIPLQGMQVCVD
jgi:hypothetical protein